MATISSSLMVFSNAEHVGLISGRRVARHAVLGHLEQYVVAVMPRVPAVVVWRRGQSAARVARGPVRLALEARAVAGGTVPKVERARRARRERRRRGRCASLQARAGRTTVRSRRTRRQMPVRTRACSSRGVLGTTPITRRPQARCMGRFHLPQRSLSALFRAARPPLRGASWQFDAMAAGAFTAQNLTIALVDAARTMASIRRLLTIRRPSAEVWDALRDVGALHTRLVAGFVTDCELDGDARVVTFANGVTARERIIDVDDQQQTRRVVRDRWPAESSQRVSTGLSCDRGHLPDSLDRRSSSQRDGTRHRRDDRHGSGGNEAHTRVSPALRTVRPVPPKGRRRGDPRRSRLRWSDTA